MKNKLYYLTLMFCFYLFGCSENKTSVENKIENESDKEEKKEQIDNSIKSCGYTNPFSKEKECRSYKGNWSEDAIKKDCSAVFTGVAGDLSTDTCASDGIIGTCEYASEEEPSNKIKVSFYGGDLGILESFCGDFLKGEWTFPDGRKTKKIDDELKIAIENTKSDNEIFVSPECNNDNCLEGIVESKQGISFSKKDSKPETGIIFYPGGGVDPRAYSFLAKKIAKEGVKFIIVPMPGNSALSGEDRALDIQNSNPEIKNWFISGHSLGGVIATSFISKNSSLLDGIILLGTYGSKDYDISKTEIKVLSIWGSKDGISTPEEINEGKKYLPETTLYKRIAGGNHSQFGRYGLQKGDFEASISLDRQHELIKSASLHFIKSLASKTEINPAFKGLSKEDTIDWCNRAQSIIAKKTENEWLSGPFKTTEIEDPNEFAKSEAGLKDETEKNLNLKAHLIYEGNHELLSAPSFLRAELWCKMKTNEYLKSLSLSSVEISETKCSDINQFIFNSALLKLKEEDSKKFEESKIKLEFGGDQLYSTGIEWLEAKIDLVEKSKDLYSLSSASLKTNDDETIPESSRNSFYCKLWTEEKVLSWILSKIKD